MLKKFAIIIFFCSLLISIKVLAWDDIVKRGIGSGGGPLYGDLDFNGNDIIDVKNIRWEPATSDTAPNDINIIAQNAYEQATGVNQDGADVIIRGSIGTFRIAVDNYNNCAGKYIRINVNLSGWTTLTEGSEWNRGASNNDAANSIASAIDALSGVDSYASGAVAYIKATDYSTWNINTAEEDATCTTLTKGVDGEVLFVGDLYPITANAFSFGSSSRPWGDIRSQYITAHGSMNMGSSVPLGWDYKTRMTSPVNGDLNIHVYDDTQGFNLDAHSTPDTMTVRNHADSAAGHISCGNIYMNDYSLFNAENICYQAPTTNEAPNSVGIHSAHSFPKGSHPESNLILSGGIAEGYITITNYANSAGDTLNVKINNTGSGVTLTADTHWACSTAADNAECACNLYAYIVSNPITGISSVDNSDGSCSDAKVFFTPENTGVYVMTLTVTDAGGGGVMGTVTQSETNPVLIASTVDAAQYTIIPGLAFLGDPDTGFYQALAGGRIDVAIDGTRRYTFGASSLSVGTGDHTIAFSTNGTINTSNSGWIKFAPSNTGVIKIDDNLNSNLTPILCFDADETTGIYQSSSGVIGFTSSASREMLISSTAITIYDKLSYSGRGGQYASSRTWAYSDMTDGGGLIGTINFADTIPDGSVVTQSICHGLTGFTGGSNTTATIQLGDGSDVDRYNTGTPSVYTTNPSGVYLDVPSGAKWHDSAATVTATITVNDDFSTISAGNITCIIYFYTP